MIADWRSKWYEATQGRTDATFPFGFVQLNSIGNGTVYDNPADEGDDLSAAFGYAGLRWSQTASYGYVPNPAMPKVFMAVSEDTPDVPGPCIGGDGQRCPSPGFNVHSRFKQPTAARLARAGLAVAYGRGDIEQGPVHGAVKRAGDNLVLSIDNIGPSSGGVELKSSRGMEVLVAGKWLSAPVTANTRDTVTIGPVPSGAARLRYNWYSNPCGIDCFGCAVYAKVTPLGKLSGEEAFLPLAPFVMDI
jgi:sialate O-acetylesterase